MFYDPTSVNPTVPRLHYELSGAGPTLVLLHGFLASSRYWEAFAAKAAQHYRVVSLDLLGFGRSPKPRASSYDYAAQITSINATLADLGITTSFTLMGHSMGALISLRYARDYPQRVSKLFLANMPIMVSAEEVRREIYGTHFIYRLGLTPFFQHLIWPLFRLTMFARLLPKVVLSKASYIFQHTAVSRLRSFRNIIVHASVLADLQALTVGTTILTGVRDRSIYMKNLLSLHLQPHIVSTTIDDGHHVPNTQPELLLQLLKQPVHTLVAQT